jgi:hypothetical protein
MVVWLMSATASQYTDPRMPASSLLNKPNFAEPTLKNTRKLTTFFGRKGLFNRLLEAVCKETRSSVRELPDTDPIDRVKTRVAELL